MWYALLKPLALKSSKWQMALGRHQVTFDSKALTMIGITVFSDRMIFSTLKTFLKFFAHGQVKEAFQ